MSLDPETITLDWRRIGETSALEEWRAEFGDYKIRVVKGHEQTWSFRVNANGRLYQNSADEAKAAALTDLKARLANRLADARRTVALYDTPPPPPPARKSVSCSNPWCGGGKLCVYCKGTGR